MIPFDEYVSNAVLIPQIMALYVFPSISLEQPTLKPPTTLGK